MVMVCMYIGIVLSSILGLGRGLLMFPGSTFTLSVKFYMYFHGLTCLVIPILCNMLALAGTSHFAILHGTRGGWYDPPPSRLAPI